MSRKTWSVPGFFWRLSAPAFARVYRLDRVLRRKLTPAGWLIASLLVAAAAFGVNTKEALIYQLFGIALALLVVAELASLRFRPKVRVERALPPFATVDVPFEYTLSVSNRGAEKLEDLHVEEAVAAPIPTAREFVAYKRRDDVGRNPFDRLVGYPRFVALARRLAGVRIGNAAIGVLEPGAESRVRLSCKPLRRGVVAFEAVRLARDEPLGLARAQSVHRMEASLLVLPRTYPVAPIALRGARTRQPGGVAFAGRVGDAEEFMGLRDYRPGDTPRRIHWKAWARTGRPVVKEYHDEFFERQALILDTHAALADERFEAAVSVAASLVVAPRARESLLDLVFVEGRAYTFTQGRGLGTGQDLLRVLAAVMPSPHDGFAALAEAVLLGAHRISGAICVLLAWDDARRALVANLRSRGIPLRVWVVRNDGEDEVLEPGPMAQDLRNFRTVHPGAIARELAQA
jgi:uncharacterized protein (DUF58 family)